MSGSGGRVRPSSPALSPTRLPLAEISPNCRTTIELSGRRNSTRLATEAVDINRDGDTNSGSCPASGPTRRARAGKPSRPLSTASGIVPQSDAATLNLDRLTLFGPQIAKQCRAPLSECLITLAVATLVKENQETQSFWSE